MSSDRMRRVDEAVRQVVGEAVAHDLKDPRVGFVTVTDVKTSPDLRHSRVFVSVLGDRKTREASIAGLDSAHGFLQKRISAQLRLKKTPELEFVLDEVTENAFRLEKLMKKHAPEAGPTRDPAPGPDDDTGVVGG